MERPGIIPAGSQSIPQSWFVKLDACLKALEWNSSKDILVDKGPGGVTGSVRRAQSGVTEAAMRPFDVQVSPIGSTGQFIAKFCPGTLNQLLPANNFDEFSFSGATMQQLKLRGYSNGRSITSCELILDSAGATQQTPTPFALPAQVDVVVAVIVDGVPFRTIAPGSVTLTGSLQFTTTRDTGGDVSELNATSYYAWVNTSPLPV